MSDADRAGSGASEFRLFLQALPDDCDRLQLRVALPPNPPPHVLKLMRTLHVDVDVDEKLERPKKWDQSGRRQPKFPFWNPHERKLLAERLLAERAN